MVGTGAGVGVERDEGAGESKPRESSGGGVKGQGGSDNPQTTL